MAEVIKMKKAGEINPAKFVGWVVGGLFVLILLFNSFTTVDAGHTGVIMTFQKPSDIVLQEGIHFKIPFIQTVVQIDNRVLKAEVNCASASKDLQNVSSTIALNYRVKTSESVSIYRNLGVAFQDTIVNPSIIESVKAVTARFTAEELITNRQVVGEQMREVLAKKIEPFGFSIEVFNITSFDFSAEFNAAIEAKQTAQQNALKAEQDLVRIKVEAEQTIEQAKAEAESYKIKSEQITEAMIVMEYIKKWDGTLPAVVSDGSVMIDIGQLMEGFSSSSTTNSSTNNSSSTDTTTAP
ncbi:MAG: prohibitin family protein [Oscillospiraceae bacterium]|jgi:regulator of protease activity HflC (stomatin/prohibitin superfamily)